MRIATAALLMSACSLAQAFAAQDGSLKVTHGALVPVCIGDAPVKAGQRSWPTSAAPVTMTFTMKNHPRPGVANHGPGFATVTFTPVVGHTYEAEVRAAPSTFSTRVWPEGQWAPVVRDRTTDEIVTAPPTWGTPSCGKAGRD